MPKPIVPVAAIAREWGLEWQDLMPYTVGAFVLFGLGSLPAGRLGDLWGRRAMMIVFFLGIERRFEISPPCDYARTKLPQIRSAPGERGGPVPQEGLALPGEQAGERRLSGGGALVGRLLHGGNGPAVVRSDRLHRADSGDGSVGPVVGTPHASDERGDPSGDREVFDGAVGGARVEIDARGVEGSARLKLPLCPIARPAGIMTGPRWVQVAPVGSLSEVPS